MSPHAWIAAAAAKWPDAEALACDGERYSYRALFERAGRAAARLARAEVAPGDRVALLLPNGLGFVVGFHAGAIRGATLLPLSFRLSAAELAYQLQDAKPRVLIVEEGELALRARAALSQIEGGKPEVVEVTELLGTALAATPPLSLESAPLALLYTSGTSGKPKGVLLSASAFAASADAAARLLGAEPGERALACLPLFHVGGLSLLLRAARSGGSVTVVPGFDVERVASVLRNDGIARVSLVATMLSRLLDAWGDARAPSSLRCVLVGGGPVPPVLLERAWKLGFPVAPTYGLTEAASQVATRDPADRRAPIEGRLRPLPGLALRILSPAGAQLAPGEVGEICVCGASVMEAYAGQPEASERALRGGWLHTGDLGALDDEGLLSVSDRRDDLIVSGGENIYPAEVEAVLVEHESIVEAAVVGRADREFGARPVAYLVAAPGLSVDPAELRRFCRHRLAGFKVPVDFVWRDALPRTAAGKLRRAALR